MMNFITENSIKDFLQNVKEDSQLASSVESVQLINHHEISNIVEKCTKDIQHLRDLFVEHLSAEEIKEKTTSSFTIISLDETTYTIVIKQKAILLEEIDLLHRVFPNLKSIELYMFNLRLDERNISKISMAENAISNIDMTFNAFPPDMSKFVMYLFDGYGENLKSLKLKKGGNISNKDQKWDEPASAITQNGKKLLENNFYLPKLENVEICHFYQYFPMAEFVKCLAESGCVLQHAAFIGVAKSEQIVLHLKTMAQKSLKSLALDTYKFPNLETLKTFPLESLSLRWGDATVIDIISTLNVLPNIKELDLGYDVNYVHFSSEKYSKLNCKVSLESLTLYHAILDNIVLENVAQYLPKLVNMNLSNCKFGSSRVSSEESLSLKNFHLKQLILENCSLYSNKKDSIEKRMINKLNVIIDSPSNYNAKITSKNQASMAKYESLSNVKNEFSYYCFSETTSRPTNTLNIFLKFIKLIKLDETGLKSIEFYTKSAIRPREDIDNFENDDFVESFVEEDIEEKDLELGDEKEIEVQDLLNDIEKKKLKNSQEADNNYLYLSTDSSSSSDDEEEEERFVLKRKSMRLKNVSTRSERLIRSKKRVKYNHDISDNGEDEEENEVNDNDNSEKTRDRLKAFIENIRLYKPVIYVYPVKTMQGYYS